MRPDGLAGDAIPRGGSILAVADSFDEHPEPPRTPPSDEQVLARLKSRAGADFDPECVEAFCSDRMNRGQTGSNEKR